MNLDNYFGSIDGFGVLATSNEQGQINGAVYGRPHVMDDGTLAFIMRHRRSYRNVLSNPHATYVFIEKGDGYTGKRLYLTMLKESDDAAVIESLRRKKRPDKAAGAGSEGVSVVYFSVDEIRPLVGDGDQ
jgi:hypothetical protein